MKAKIDYEKLQNVNLNDNFFNSLKNDYKNFETWFLKKQKEGYFAYVLKNDDKLDAFFCF